MIEIRNKRDCCGCNACVQKCPQQCIGQSEDAEGFIYPQVDKARCVGCGLCEKVCPVINQNPKSKPLKVMAGRNGNEEIRMQEMCIRDSIIGRTDHRPGRGCLRCPVRRELECRTQLHRMYGRTGCIPGQQIRTKQDRGDIQASQRILATGLRGTIHRNPLPDCGIA